MELSYLCALLSAPVRQLTTAAAGGFKWLLREPQFPDAASLPVNLFGVEKAKLDSSVEKSI